MTLVLLLALGPGCATTMIPVHPSVARVDEGERVSGVRFDPDRIALREPGVPVSTGNLWNREVAKFAAERLNAHIAAAEGVPAAYTEVTFEMRGPNAIQIGTYKEMTVALRSTLPDGRVVKSAPQSAYLDTNWEFAAEQCLIYGGPVLDIAAFVVAIYLLSTNQLFTPWACGGIALLAITGLSLNFAQGGLTMLIAHNEQQRWSDLFAAALVQHADDVRAEIARAPVRSVAPAGRSPTTPALPPPPPAPAPPPLLGDPADAPDDDPPPPTGDPAAPPSAANPDDEPSDQGLPDDDLPPSDPAPPPDSAPDPNAPPLPDAAAPPVALRF